MKKFSSLSGKTPAELAKKLETFCSKLGHNNYQFYISGDLKEAIVIHEPGLEAAKPTGETTEE